MKWISGLKPSFKNQVQTWKNPEISAEFQVYFKKSSNIILLDFLSSPIACIAFERTELLKTEIVLVVFFGSSCASKLKNSLLSELFYTYGMYTYVEASLRKWLVYKLTS